MGDIADWMLDQAICGGLEDDWEQLPRQKTCAYCGKGHLYWQETEFGWRLFDRNGNMHSCTEHHKSQE